MITGVVTDAHKPVVGVRVRGAGGAEEKVEALVDTGFDGFLTLPPAVIARLGLSWRSRDRVMLADGRWARFDLYDGLIDWDGRPRRVYIEAADIDPIVGTGLLVGYRVGVDFRPGGPVVIEPLT